MKTRLPLVALTLASLALPALAADWPQWQGPDRTNVSHETGLLHRWPAGGPPLLWTFTDAGIGFSGPAIVGDRLYTMGADNDNEYVLAVDVRTGKEVWRSKVGQRFRNGYGDGPRSTPTVDGSHLYALGGRGDLVCVETGTGKEAWRVSLPKDLGGRMMSGWGYSESVLVDGDRVICSPGGTKGTLAALDKSSGQVVWRSTDINDPAAYSSVVVAETGGVRQYVQMTNKGVVGVAAKDGHLLWQSQIAANSVAVIPTPVVHNDYVYATSAYNAGCGLLKLEPAGDGVKAEKVYANKIMQNKHGGVVLVDGHVYGYSEGRGWVCQDFMTGKSVWENKAKLGQGSLTYADGHLYLYANADGTTVLLRASPEGWKEDGRFTIPRQTARRRQFRSSIWTHPVVANGRLYLRDLDLLFCFDVSGRSARTGTSPVKPGG